jgi:hypothetical protein
LNEFRQPDAISTANHAHATATRLRVALIDIHERVNKPPKPLKKIRLGETIPSAPAHVKASRKKRAIR